MSARRFSIVGIVGLIRRIKKPWAKSPVPTPDHPEFGGSGITRELYDWIIAHVEPGSQILEFGAGLVSTAKLGQRYQLTSVEHDPAWVGQFSSTYIYAPLSAETEWYSMSDLSQIENQFFELAIIDGPPGTGRRFGILLNLNLIERIPILIVDDSDRPAEKVLTILLAKYLGRSYEDFGHFSVIRNMPSV